MWGPGSARGLGHELGRICLKELADARQVGQLVALHVLGVHAVKQEGTIQVLDKRSLQSETRQRSGDSDSRLGPWLGLSGQGPARALGSLDTWQRVEEGMLEGCTWLSRAGGRGVGYGRRNGSGAVLRKDLNLPGCSGNARGFKEQPYRIVSPGPRAGTRHAGVEMRQVMSRLTQSWLCRQVASRVRRGQGAVLWMMDMLHQSQEMPRGIPFQSRQDLGAQAPQTFIKLAPQPVAGTLEPGQGEGVGRLCPAQYLVLLQLLLLGLLILQPGLNQVLSVLQLIDAVLVLTLRHLFLMGAWEVASLSGHICSPRPHRPLPSCGPTSMYAGQWTALW